MTNKEKIEILMDKINELDGTLLDNGDLAISYQEIVNIYNIVIENDK